MCEFPRVPMCPSAQWDGSDYVPLVNLIGIYFQIRDDYMNLQSDQVKCLCLRET